VIFATSQLLKFNPGPWASVTGQDFVLNNAAKAIDFATIHAWPDNWGLG
jgi:mannan endo-1,4-beta-mannosidase